MDSLPSFLISIHALRVEGDIGIVDAIPVLIISIHALRVEGDRFLLCHAQRLYEISIHALRVEGDVFLFALVLFILRFLSTPSGWRATANAYPYLSYFNISIHALRVESDRRSARFPNRSGHFYPRPPGGGRPVQTLIVTRSLNFYPRPPGGGRRTTLNSDTAAQRFLSTPSGWRATEVVSLRCTVVCISIHALRVEGDPKSRVVDTGWTDFYPRPPGGGRPGGWRIPVRVEDFYPRPPGGGRRLQTPAERQKKKFLSTPSGWRATYSPPYTSRIEPDISIHALRVEGDIHWIVKTLMLEDFYPRPPGGGRQKVILLRRFKSIFLSTPSGWRATPVSRGDVAFNVHFYPRPPGGGRRHKVKRRVCC